MALDHLVQKMLPESSDLLLVEGNPTVDITKVTDRDNLKIIMKDGVIYKNAL